MTRRIILLDTGKEWGGGTNSMLELLKRIERSRYEICCVFYDDYKKGSGARISEELARLGLRFLQLPRRPQSKVAKLLKEILRTLLFFSKSLRKNGIFLVDYAFRIRPDAARISAILRRDRVDLLYLNNQPSSNLEGILAAVDTGVPVIQHNRIDVSLNPIEIRIANRSLRKIVCVSDGVRQSLVAQGIEPQICAVIHNGISSDTRPRLTPAEVRAKSEIGDEFLVGTVGSLVRRKRVADLIQVISVLVRDKHRPVKCLVVGEGPERSRLIAEAEKLGISDRITFVGFQDDAISYINALDVFLLPSEKEGLPRVILEAMLVAKPVVASRVVGPSELVVDGQTGYLIPLGEIRMWVDALEALIRDAALRKCMGEAGRQRVLERFSIERYVTGVEAVFDEVLVNISTVARQ